MTDVLRTAVILETKRYSVRGDVSVPAGERLSDYANQLGRDFFAITDAYMAPLDAPDRERHVGFMLVARHEIGTLMPADMPVGPGLHDTNAEALYAFLEA